MMSRSIAQNYFLIYSINRMAPKYVVKHTSPQAVRIVKAKRKKRKKKTLLGNRFQAKLRYWGFNTLTPTLGILQSQICTANGMFDPDITQVGHQPRGFDQIMPLYDHFAVTSSRITVKFSMQAGQPPLVCSIVLKDTATVITSGTAVLEDRNRVYGWCTPEEPLTLSYSFNAKSFLGANPIHEKDLQGGIAANPDEKAYFHIYMFDLNAHAYTQPITVLYTIDYDATFIEPKQPGQS